MELRKMLYIASPLRGDVEQNIANALHYCAVALENGYLPIAPHAMYPGVFDDEIPEQRAAALEVGLQFLRQCAGMWVCGDRISAGMQGEIELAQQLGKSVEYKPKGFFTQAAQTKQPPHTFQQLRENSKSALETLQSNGAGIVDLLRMKAQYASCSLLNLAALRQQRPDAQFLAPQQTWSRMGYRVNDLKSIKLWSAAKIPCFTRDGKLVDVSLATKQELTEIGKGGIAVQERTQYKAHFVYDIAQTDCPKQDYEKVMETPYMGLTRGELFAALQNTAENCGISVTMSNAPALELTKGHCQDGKIVLSSRIHSSQQLAVLADAFAHGLVAQTSSQSPEVQQFEADAFSFLLQSKLGLPEQGMQCALLHDANSLDSAVQHPELLEGCINRVQRMLGHTEKRMGQSISEMELGIEQQPEQTAKKEQRLTETQRKTNQNFISELD